MSSSFAMQAVFVFLLLVAAAGQQLKSNIPYADPQPKYKWNDDENKQGDGTSAIPKK